MTRLEKLLRTGSNSVVVISFHCLAKSKTVSKLSAFTSVGVKMNFLGLSKNCLVAFAIAGICMIQSALAAEIYFPENIKSNPSFQKALIEAVTQQHRTFTYRHEGEPKLDSKAGKHIYSIRYGSSFPIAKTLFGRDVVFSKEALPQSDQDNPPTADRHAWLVRSQGALENFLKSEKTFISCVLPKQKSEEAESDSEDSTKIGSGENLRQCRVYTKRPQLPDIVTQVRTFVPGIKTLRAEWEREGLTSAEMEARIRGLKQKEVTNTYRNPTADVLFLEGPPMFQIKVKGEDDAGMDYSETKASRYPKWQGPYFYFVLAEVPENYWPVAKKIHQVTKRYISENDQIRRHLHILRKLALSEGSIGLRAEYRSTKQASLTELGTLDLIANLREQRRQLLKLAFFTTVNQMTLEAMTPYYHENLDNRDYDPSSNKSDLPWWALTYGYDEKAGLAIRDSAANYGLDWTF